jgi:thiol reductant ABC exporter CydC subunit
MRELLKVFRERSREMSLALLLGGTSLAAAVGLLATSAWLISMASTRPPILVLEVAIVSVRFFGLSRGALKYGSRIVEHSGALKIQTTLRVKIYQRFSRLLPEQYGSLRRGSLLSQIISDVELSQDLWLRVASPWSAALISGSAGVAIIHWLLPSAGKAIGLIFLAALALIPFIATISSTRNQSREEESQLFDQILQITESAPESLIFNYDQELMLQMKSQQAKISQIELRNASRSGSASALYFALLGSSVLLALWLAAQGFTHHHLAGINIAVVSLLPLAIFDGMSSLPGAFSQLRQILGAIAHVEPLLVAQPEEDISYPPIPGKLTLELRGLLPVLEGATTREISVSVKSGEALLITGRSGAGKSSILAALLGFIPYSGEILINGSEFTPGNFEMFSTLLQDDYLFGSSIRENLKIGRPEASDEELLQALAIVELDGFISSLPEGLGTMIGALGYNFSGGEKQRLKLARTLLREAPIYLLDEPFEFLDHSMVERIAEGTARKLKDRLLIIVSHLPLATEAITISL